MRRIIVVALLTAAGSVPAADSSQYKFDFTVKVGDANPVTISGAVPPATSHRMQATDHITLELRAPTGREQWPAMGVKIIDDSSGAPVVRFTEGSRPPDYTTTFTVCGDRVIRLDPSPPEPASCSGLPPMAKPDPVVGDRDCWQCIGPYEGLPENLTSRARIAPIGEPGEPLIVTGRAFGADGKPRPGVIVYAYHTNAQGIYPASTPPRSMLSNFHGQLRGWAKTDARGRYTFETIRPGGYPNERNPTEGEPQHIHMHVIERGCATYWIDELLFTDDPRLTPERRKAMSRDRGGPGIVTPRRVGKTWHAERDIQLGRDISDYPGCTADRIRPALRNDPA